MQKERCYAIHTEETTHSFLTSSSVSSPGPLILHLKGQAQLSCCFLHRFECSIVGVEFSPFWQFHFELNSEVKFLEVHSSRWTHEAAEELSPGRVTSRMPPFVVTFSLCFHPLAVYMN